MNQRRALEQITGDMHTILAHGGDPRRAAQTIRRELGPPPEPPTSLAAPGPELVPQLVIRWVHETANNPPIEPRVIIDGFLRRPLISEVPGE